MYGPIERLPFNDNCKHLKKTKQIAPSDGSSARQQRTVALRKTTPGLIGNEKISNPDSQKRVGCDTWERPMQ
jgi:hypothetical protein